jgi:hypothetical protein
MRLRCPYDAGRHPGAELVGRPLDPQSGLVVLSWAAVARAIAEVATDLVERSLGRQKRWGPPQSIGSTVLQVDVRADHHGAFVG